MGVFSADSYDSDISLVSGAAFSLTSFASSRRKPEKENVTVP